MSIILQKQITLDEAILEGVKTFRNGCNFRIKIDDGGLTLEYGCYGVHMYLCQGAERLLLEWLTDGELSVDNPKKALPISRETLMALMERNPCDRCGAPFVKGECDDKNSKE